MKNCTTNWKTIWLLLTLFTLQTFFFVGQSSQAIATLPFLPQTELVKDSKGLLFVDIYSDLDAEVQKRKSSTSITYTVFNLQQKILHNRLEALQFKQIKQTALQFDAPTFFSSLKIPADESAIPLFFA